MEFRWVIYCDEYGRKSEPILQYRERGSLGGYVSEWAEVPIVEKKSYSNSEE